MAAPNTIAVDKLMRRVGTPKCPVLIDVRTEDDFAADPRLLPASLRRNWSDAAAWAPEFAGRSVVTICQQGRKISHGTAAWLRTAGAVAEALEGGFEAWSAATLPLVQVDAVPPRDREGRTVWVTRARPKVDRIACPWLVRRFVDPSAVFLFVPPAEVGLVADRFGATPFDIEDVFFSHRGDRATFDIMVDEFGLGTDPLRQLAAIVRGADTARMDLAPEAAGLLAVSLGLSRMFSDDLEQLEAGMLLYDALYRWCRDATEETHSWPATTRARAEAVR